MSVAIEAMERGWLPDSAIRFGIRRLLSRRLAQARTDAATGAEEKFIASLSSSPVAIATDKANEQHYEVPAAFYLQVLGPHLKYSSCYWPDEIHDLGVAEAAMLELTCERAQLEDGMDILELGCGWGSLTLWMAKQYPNARITAVSNSNSQREFILKQAKERGLNHVQVITADMNDFSAETGHFDRVVSVEMFEHMRNYTELLHRVRTWLKPTGKLFVHIFCHADRTYPFETRGSYDWMARYFFTGGIMPAEKLLSRFDNDLQIEQQWSVPGQHYAKTLRAWLDLMDERHDTVMPILKEVYGDQEGARWFQRWRVFFMACEELFAFNEGQEWYVTHMLFHVAKS